MQRAAQVVPLGAETTTHDMFRRGAAASGWAAVFAATPAEENSASAKTARSHDREHLAASAAREGYAEDMKNRNRRVIENSLSLARDFRFVNRIFQHVILFSRMPTRACPHVPRFAARKADRVRPKGAPRESRSKARAPQRGADRAANIETRPRVSSPIPAANRHPDPPTQRIDILGALCSNLLRIRHHAHFANPSLWNMPRLGENGGAAPHTTAAGVPSGVSKAGIAYLHRRASPRFRSSSRHSPDLSNTFPATRSLAQLARCIRKWF